MRGRDLQEAIVALAGDSQSAALFDERTHVWKSRHVSRRRENRGHSESYEPEEDLAPPVSGWQLTACVAWNGGRKRHRLAPIRAPGDYGRGCERERRHVNAHTELAKD